MVNADVGARKHSCIRIVDAGHEPFRRQHKIYLVVYLPVGGTVAASECNRSGFVLARLEHAMLLFWMVCAGAAC